MPSCFNDGAAHFTAGPAYAVPGYPFETVFADINHVGKLDIVVSGQGISVLPGNGDGTFQSAVTSLQGTVEYHIALARFDGTSQVDVAYTDEFSVEISHGDGNGYFVQPVNYPTAETPFDMQVGDFMDTGQPGVAILENTGEIQIWPGETGGVFGTPQSITMTKHYFPGLLAEGDFNGDEIPDIVAAGAESPLGGSPFGMQILLGGAAGLQPQTTNMGLPFADSFAVGDFNSDGKQDVVYVGNNVIAVAFGDGQGKLISYLFKRVRISCPGLRWLISTATAYRMWSPGHFSPSAVVIWIGKGDGTFQAPVPIPVASDGVPNVAVGDFNRDGIVDIAAAAGSGSGCR
jgi:hypothetical protein